MIRTRSIEALVGVAVLSMLLLAGCSNGDEAPASPSPTTTSTSGPIVTVTPTASPPASVTSEPTMTPTEPTLPASPTPIVTTGPLPGPGATVEVAAPIVSVDVRVAESFPPQYFVEVVSALPNGCHQFSRFEVSRAGTTVRIDVWNTVPANLSVVACTMIYGEVTSNVALGSDFASGVEYRLQVNDVTQTFTAQ